MRSSNRLSKSNLRGSLLRHFFRSKAKAHSAMDLFRARDMETIFLSSLPSSYGQSVEIKLFVLYITFIKTYLLSPRSTCEGVKVRVQQAKLWLTSELYQISRTTLAMPRYRLRNLSPSPPTPYLPIQVATR